MKRILAAAALTAAALAPLPTSTPAHAQVTNCVTIVVNYSNPGSFYGNCLGTTPNYPYTTQFAVQGKCKAGSSRVWVTSGWWTAGNGTIGAFCPGGWVADLTATPYYLFR
jgi:hypothetical protein